MAAPVNTAPPVLTGTPNVGQTLTCTMGAWTGADALESVWLRNGSPIAGTRMEGDGASTYVVGPGDTGQGVSCQVSGRNQSGLTVATSSVVTVTRTSSSGRAVQTVRAAVNVGGEAGSTNVGVAVDFAVRPLLLLPVTTTRWRLRIRNVAADTITPGTGTIDLTGVWIGAPAAPATHRCPTTFAAPPVQAIPATPGALVDGTEWVSAWVTNPAAQIPAHQSRMLSIGYSGPASTWSVSSRGQNFATGAAATAGNQGEPTGSWGNGIMFDARLEYECATDLPVGLFIGDSITAGNTDGTSGAMHYEGWPHAAALREGFVCLNAGIPSSTAQQWATPGDYHWTRLDLTTPPDFACIMLGTNDVNTGRTQAQLQADLTSVVANVKALGVPIVGLATIMPRNLGATPEGIRVAVNDWIRTLPVGAAFCWDMDRQVYLQATPATCDLKVVPLNVHPNIAGHQRLAALACRFHS